MSTILDALRKLQREREDSPDPDDLRESVAREIYLAPRSRFPLTWIALLAVVAVSAGSLAMLLFWGGPSGGDAPGVVVQVPQQKAKPLRPARAQAEPAPPTAKRRPGPQPRTLDPEQIKKRLAQAKPKAGAKAPATPPAKPKTSTKAPAKPPAKPKATTRAKTAAPQGQDVAATKKPSGSSTVAKSASPSREATPRASKPKTSARPPAAKTKPAVVAEASKPKAAPRDNPFDPGPETLVAPVMKPEAKPAPTARPESKPTMNSPQASEPLQTASVTPYSRGFPRLSVQSVRWHPDPMRRIASVTLDAKRSFELREGDVVGDARVHRIDPGAVELRMGQASTRFLLQP